MFMGGITMPTYWVTIEITRGLIHRFLGDV
jgi:hypothetical protein